MSAQGIPSPNQSYFALNTDEIDGTGDNEINSPDTNISFYTFMQIMVKHSADNG